MNWFFWIVAVCAAVIGILTLIGLCLPKTTHIQREARLRQSQEVVWKTILDYQAYPSWQPGLREVKGIRQGEQVKVMDMAITLPSGSGQWGWIEVWGDCSGTEVYLSQVVEEQPPKRLVIREEAVDYNYRAVSTYELTPVDSQMTILRVTWERDLGPVSRVLDRVVKEKGKGLEYFLTNLRKSFGEA